MSEAFERTPWTVTIKSVVPYLSMRDIEILSQRLVMAVNALAGVSEEAIETGVLRDAIKESGLVPMEE